MSKGLSFEDFKKSFFNSQSILQSHISILVKIKRKYMSIFLLDFMFLKPYSRQYLIQLRQMLQQNCPLFLMLTKCVFKFQNEAMPINLHAKEEIPLFFTVIQTFVHYKQCDRSELYYFVSFIHRQYRHLTHQVSGTGLVPVFGLILTKININT